MNGRELLAEVHVLLARYVPMNKSETWRTLNGCVLLTAEEAAIVREAAGEAYLNDVRDAALVLLSVD